MAPFTAISRAVGALAGMLLIAALSAGQAAADFRPVPSPPEPVADLAVADSTHWAARLESGQALSVTANAGTTWTPVAPAGQFALVDGVGAAADGTFRMVVGSWPGGGPDPVAQVYRVTATGDATPVGPVVNGRAAPSSVVVDDDGATWFVTSGPTTVRIVGADGSLTSAIPPGPDCQPCPAPLRTARGVRLGVGDDLLRMEGGMLVPAEVHPALLVDGDLWLGPGSASWDAGAHWAEPLDVYPIARAPGLGGARLLHVGSGRLAERWAPWLFRGTGLTLPSTNGLSASVVDAGDALVAWSDDGIWLHEGPLPPFPDSVGGAIEPDTRTMVERANLLRADAGFPPLVGDAIISQASRNHSRYTALNGADEWAHGETPSKPGFTGYDPGARCSAVGARCGSEIMFPEPEPDPVGGWLATVYHRPLVGDPAVGSVGAGRVEGGWSTMNGGERIGVLVDAVGFPNGRWRGDPGFAGEVPDPVEDCTVNGQAIAYPVGIAVTLYAPASEVGATAVPRIAVRRRSDGARLAGCLLHGRPGVAHFVLDDPLVAGEIYDAEGDWDAGGVIRTRRWSFTYAPEESQASRARRRAGGRTPPRPRCLGRVATLVSSTGAASTGTRRGDVIRGSARGELIRAGGGADLVCAGRGRDVVRAGAGADRVTGGPGRDRVAGGPGDDRLALADGTRDRADCGPGRHDRVVADAVDQVRRCEQVSRRR